MNFSEIKDHLSRFRVGIAGAGGLGSNCAVSLARSGVGTLVIADFDKITISNLNRQYYFMEQAGQLKVSALKHNIEMIGSGTIVVSHKIRLDKENIPLIFKGCDAIVEAIDQAEMKEMLAETVQTRLPGIPLVMASGLAGWGNNDTIRCRKIDDLLYSCGDESTEVSDELPPLAPRVGIVANMQANIVIEILMNKK
jgi:sulfur carrier protein ThiS adenylyltransferase